MSKRQQASLPSSARVIVNQSDRTQLRFKTTMLANQLESVVAHLEALISPVKAVAVEMRTREALLILLLTEVEGDI